MQEATSFSATWPACPRGCVGFPSVPERLRGQNPACSHAAMEKGSPQSPPDPLALEDERAGVTEPPPGPPSPQLLSSKVLLVPGVVCYLDGHGAPIWERGRDCTPLPQFCSALGQVLAPVEKPCPVSLWFSGVLEGQGGELKSSGVGQKADVQRAAIRCGHWDRPQNGRCLGLSMPARPRSFRSQP